ncbi:ankyrin repeat domain-containing protein [Rhodocyclaceae bacterium SMB388]
MRRLSVFLMLLCFAVLAQANSYENSLSSARLGDTRQLVDLLNRGIDPNTIDEQGNSLLILAAGGGHAATVNAILEYRPNVSHRNLAGDSALMLAALRGHDEIVDRLLAADAELNHDGWTPLVYAAFEGRLAMVEKFLQRGADVNALAPNGSNALMFAARNGHIDVVRRLLQTDVNVHQQNDRGFNAERWALSTGNTDIAALIAREARRRPVPPPPASPDRSLRLEIR